MDLEMIIVSEVSQTEEDEYVTYIWPQKKKKIQMSVFTKQKQTHT